MAPDHQESSLSHVNKPNCKSTIWKYFGFVPDSNGKPEDTNKLQCKICRVTVNTKTGNMSNLRFHLKQKHPQLPYSAKFWRGKTLAKGTSFANILPSQIPDSLKWLIYSCKFANVFLAKTLK